jgi:Flp pilus assembly pilin Flp
MKMAAILTRLWVEEEGQDLTEYALLMVLLVLASVLSLGNFAAVLNTYMQSAANQMTTTT